MVIALNKIDKIPNDANLQLESKTPKLPVKLEGKSSALPVVCVSALTGSRVDDLLRRISNNCASQFAPSTSSYPTTAATS